MPAGTTNRDRGRRWLPPIFFLTLNLLFGLQAQAANGLPLGRTASPNIGSVMALLATFEDAGVLPPEGTPDANRIIKATIQFQSAFLKSRHPAVQQFFSTAQRNKFGARAEEVEASFRQAGWSGDSFMAVIEAGQAPEAWTGNDLADGFHEFNIGKADFEVLAGLYRNSVAVFTAKGSTFQDVYAQRRREMPGVKSE